MSTAQMQRDQRQPEPAYLSPARHPVGFGLGTAALLGVLVLGVMFLPDLIRYTRIKRM
jgi:hypothetical protein